MIYKSNDKYYIKVSGYLIEVIPFMNGYDLDFKTTENKIEITPNVLYKAIGNDEIIKEINNKKSKPQVEETGLKLKKVSERTHKFKYDD